jgi:hypothetical protein
MEYWMLARVSMYAWVLVSGFVKYVSARKYARSLSLDVNNRLNWPIVKESSRPSSTELTLNPMSRNPLRFSFGS